MAPTPKEQLQKAWEENPMGVILISGMALTALARVVDSLSVAQSRRAYAKQIDHNIRYGRPRR